MLYKYSLVNKSLIALDEATFQSMNILERQDIEAWVEEQPEMLGEDLLIISSEYSDFDKTNERPDILALDKRGKVVVVELKRDNSGKSADLQAIKYAAYCSTLRYDDVINMRMAYLNKRGVDHDLTNVRNEIDSFIENPEFDEIDDQPRVVIVAREFRQEVTATALWLLTFGLDISCIKLSPYRISEDEIGITVQRIIPTPEAEDYQIRVAMKDNSTGTLTKRKREYLEFWTELKMRLENELDVNLQSPHIHSWYSVPIGVQGVHLEWMFVRGRRFRIELHFEKASKELNLKNMELLHPSMESFSHENGMPLHVEKDWTKNRVRICLETNRSRIDDELVDYAVSVMVRLHKHITSDIEKLNESLF